MKSLINKALNAARKYSVIEWGFLKICLFCFGILFGVVFREFFLTQITKIGTIYGITFFLTPLAIAGIICGATWAWLVYKTFFKYWNQW